MILGYFGWTRCFWCGVYYPIIWNEYYLINVICAPRWYSIMWSLVSPTSRWIWTPKTFGCFVGATRIHRVIAACRTSKSACKSDQRQVRTVSLENPPGLDLVSIMSLEFMILLIHQNLAAKLLGQQKKHQIFSESGARRMLLRQYISNNISGLHTLNLQLAPSTDLRGFKCCVFSPAKFVHFCRVGGSTTT